MSFSVTIPRVSNQQLAPLLTYLATGGWKDPLVKAESVPDIRRAAEGLGALPASWRQVRSLEDQKYRWPSHLEHYERYIVYETTTDRDGTVQIALGDAPRDKWGRERRYRVAFLSSGSPQVPLVEFLETDPKGSGEMLAVIRGLGGAGGRKMFSPSDTLPAPYPEAFQIRPYRDQIEARNAWNKLAVVVSEDDRESMLNHALLQARRRGDV
jgi:hypothetical protein